MNLRDSDVADLIPEEFLDCEIVYQNEWMTYEESGWIVVFRFFDEMFSIEYENCVMSEDNDFVFDPQEVTNLYEIKAEWDDINSDISEF